MDFKMSSEPLHYVLQIRFLERLFGNPSLPAARIADVGWFLASLRMVNSALSAMTITLRQIIAV
jgi:hypothetical protein